jgi:hypothetical protein
MSGTLAYGKRSTPAPSHSAMIRSPRSNAKRARLPPVGQISHLSPLDLPSKPPSSGASTRPPGARTSTSVGSTSHLPPLNPTKSRSRPQGRQPTPNTTFAEGEPDSTPGGRRPDEGDSARYNVTLLLSKPDILQVCVHGCDSKILQRGYLTQSGVGTVPQPRVKITFPFGKRAGACRA